MSRFWLLSLLTAGIVLANITPRASVEEYPFRADAPNLKIGAAFMDPDKSRKLFPMLKRDYIAIEVGIFPNPGETPEITPDDFALQIIDNPDSLVRRAEPWAVVANHKPRKAPRVPNPIPGNVDVWAGGGIGTGTGGPIGNDPTCRSCPTCAECRNGGVYGGRGGGIGVGVGTGSGGRRYPDPNDPQPDSGSDADVQVRTMEVRELSAGPVKKPASGYIFFPLPRGKSKKGYELIYYGEKKVLVSMPAVTR